MNISWRNKLITVFVVLWLALFYYESTCYYYLQPLFHRSLPHMKFLFPPAGWIMFYQITDDFGYAQVYGVKGQNSQEIDPHQILQTRAIGYDNINRNVLSTVLDQSLKPSFCAFLKRKFPYFENFVVTYVQYPHLVEQPFERQQAVVYQCNE